MSARPMLSHVKASDGELVLMPEEIKAAAVRAGVEHAEVESKWRTLEDLESPALAPDTMDVIITNPPYSKIYEELNAAGRRTGNWNYWRKVIPLSYNLLREGGVLILIAPITPNVQFEGFIIEEVHNENPVEFADVNGKDVYTKSCWVKLRKNSGSKTSIPFPTWANFDNLTLRYGSKVDIYSQPTVLLNCSSGSVTKDLSVYNTNCYVIQGSKIAVEQFYKWAHSEEGVSILNKIKGKDYMRVTIARDRLGMKK